MKKIPIGDCIYEFHCSPQLLAESLNNLEFLKPKMNWHNAIVGDTAALKLGYMDEHFTVPYYDNNLFEWFQECLDQVVNEELPIANLAICDSWLTKSVFGRDKIDIHVHASSVLSGVFYFDTYEQSETEFYHDTYLSKVTSSMFCHNGPSPELWNQLKSKKVISRTEAGKLVIFPSNILHKVSQFKKVKSIRHTLAFNTFFNGQIPGATITAHMTINVKSSKEKFEEWQTNNNISSGA